MDAFEEVQRLDVAHGAADFGDYEVEAACGAERAHAALDFVGDVRHYLHGLAEIVAVALFVDHALVYAAGGDVVGA